MVSLLAHGMRTFLLLDSSVVFVIWGTCDLFQDVSDIIYFKYYTVPWVLIGKHITISEHPFDWLYLDVIICYSPDCKRPIDYPYVLRLLQVFTQVIMACWFAYRRSFTIGSRRRCRYRPHAGNCGQLEQETWQHTRASYVSKCFFILRSQFII